MWGFQFTLYVYIKNFDYSSVQHFKVAATRMVIIFSMLTFRVFIVVTVPKILYLTVYIYILTVIPINQLSFLT